MLICVYINYVIAHVVFVAVITSGNLPTLWQNKRRSNFILSGTKTLHLHGNYTGRYSGYIYTVSTYNWYTCLDASVIVKHEGDVLTQSILNLFADIKHVKYILLCSQQSSTPTRKRTLLCI